MAKKLACRWNFSHAQSMRRLWAVNLRCDTSSHRKSPTSKTRSVLSKILSRRATPCIVLIGSCMLQLCDKHRVGKEAAQDPIIVGSSGDGGAQGINRARVMLLKLCGVPWLNRRQERILKLVQIGGHVLHEPDSSSRLTDYLQIHTEVYLHPISAYLALRSRQFCKRTFRL